jgi:hypothetical protein
MLRDDVAALYVDPRGPYPGLVVDWYDETRDARTYAGPWPVVAHPPCRNWSSLRHLAKVDDSALGLLAIEQVREYGGIVEQPAGSRLFAAAGIGRDQLTEVDQCAYGHVARKRTWIWAHRCQVTGIRTGGTPTHWCSGGRTKRYGMGGIVPAGIKVCSAQQRRRTPVAFAVWLLEMASHAAG